MNASRPSDWTTDEWHTPPEILADLEREFGPFTLDPCCRQQTAKAPRFYTRDDDGLLQPWFGRVWLNPPYSNPGPWLKKAKEVVRNGTCELVVALLPASTDTAWFHDYVLGHAEIRFKRGRVRFYGWENTPIGSPKTPSIFAIYRP
jgi:phage N-6-adenine-methyltransferase